MFQPLSRRDSRKQETRLRLLEAGQTLFREKGYSATTVEEITGRAGVAKGTFFNYFATKEAFLNEVALWRIVQLRAALDVTTGAPASPVARIKLLVQLLREQATPHMGLARRVVAMHMHAPQPLSHEARHRLPGLLTDLVREAQACGEIRADVEVEAVSDLLRNACSRQVMAQTGPESEAPPATYGWIVDLLMEGLSGPAVMHE